MEDENFQDDFDSEQLLGDMKAVYQRIKSPVDLGEIALASELMDEHEMEDAASEHLFIHSAYSHIHPAWRIAAGLLLAGVLTIYFAKESDLREDFGNSNVIAKSRDLPGQLSGNDIKGNKLAKLVKQAKLTKLFPGYSHMLQSKHEQAPPPSTIKLLFRKAPVANVDTVANVATVAMAQSSELPESSMAPQSDSQASKATENARPATSKKKKRSGMFKLLFKKNKPANQSTGAL